MIRLPKRLQNIVDFKSLKKEQIRLFALVGILALIVVIVYIRLILGPQMGRVFTALAKAGKTAVELRGAKSDIANMERFRQNIESYRGKMGGYEKTLPSEHQIPAILEELSGLAKGAGVKIVGITPLAIKRNGGKERIYVEMPILITAKSGYHELGRFLDNLENCGTFMNVSDIQVKLNRSTPKRHDVELLVVTYLLKD